MKLMLALISLLMVIGNVFAQEKLSLEDCINIALEKNSALKQKNYSNESAGYDVTASYSNIMPSLDIGAGASRTKYGKSSYIDAVPVGQDTATGEVVYRREIKTIPAYSNDNFTLRATINQNIFDGFGWWNQIQQARANKKSSDFDLLNETNSVILTVQNNFYNLVKQDKLYDVYSVAVKRSQDQLARTEKMYELGSKSRLDVFQSKVNLGNDKINLLTQQNIVSDARRILNISLGRDPNEPLEVATDAQAELSSFDLDELINISTENQPLLKKNEADVKSRGIGVSLARSNYYPRITAFYEYGRRNSDLNKVYKDYFDKDFYSSVGLNLSWNLFNGFSDHANVQKAKLSEKSALEFKENFKRQLKSRIKGFNDNYNSYIEIIKINEENLEAANEEVRLANERYTIGAGTSLDVREAQVKLTRAEETLIAARYNALITLAQLDNELGITEKKRKK